MQLYLLYKILALSQGFSAEKIERRLMKDGKYFVVYVEDSPVAREMVRDVFENSDYLLDTAVDVYDLEKRILSDENILKQVDIFVFDFDMPEMTGTQIASVLDSVYQDLQVIPFIIFSGRPREEVLAAIEEARSYSPTFAKNFKGYLEKKGGSAVDLKAKISEALS